MLNRLDQVLIAISLSACGLISGCASNSVAPNSVATNSVATNSVAPDAVAADSNAKFVERPTVASLNPEMYAAVTDDNVWSVNQKAEIDDEGRLVYRTSPEIINDPNYNRAQLNLHGGQRGQVSASGLYDPVTGRPIRGLRTLRGGPRSSGGGVTSGGVRSSVGRSTVPRTPTSRRTIGGGNTRR